MNATDKIKMSEYAKSYPILFKSSSWERILRGAVIRIDPPCEIEIKQEFLRVKTWRKEVEVSWNRIHFIRARSWIRSIRGGGGPIRSNDVHVRVLDLDLDGVPVCFDCSDKFGDFDFPQVFIDELARRGIYPKRK